ncbi:MAG: outer membrane lipoprotein carrier protein LolA [Acidobacteriota bacterium]
MLFVTGLLIAAAVAAPFAARIDSYYAGVNVLQADFEQLTRSAATRVTKSERGVFMMSRQDDLLRFEYREPERKIFLYRSGAVDFYVPEDRQLIRYRLEEGADILPFLFLLGRRRLADCISLPLVDEKPAGPGVVLLRLQPVRGGDEEFYVEADTGTGSVTRIIFLDELRNRVEIRLSHQKRAVGLPPGAARIETPAGVEIIERD